MRQKQETKELINLYREVERYLIRQHTNNIQDLGICLALNSCRNSISELYQELESMHNIYLFEEFLNKTS